MAIGSRRTTPTWPAAAAVVSDESVAPMNTPCVQSRDCVTSGMVERRRPPKKMAEIGTPRGLSYSGARIGTCPMGVQNREFGCAAGRSSASRSEEHTSELQSRGHHVCRLLLEKKKSRNAETELGCRLLRH